MDAIEFNGRLNNALARLRLGGPATIEDEQERLRALLPQIEDEKDRRWAAEQVEELPRDATPRQRSALYTEALELQASAFHAGGTDEEHVAALEDARRRIWDIADRAPEEESANIRALTRMLEHLEENIRNPPWDDPQPSGSR